MPRTPVSIPDTHALPWQGIPTRDGNVPGPVLKVLTTDPETGALTILIHLPPGWHDDELDWHPSAEEGFRLHGWVEIAGRHLPVGNYLYRPAGILHGPVKVCPLEGATGIQRFPAPLRILRHDPADGHPHEDLVCITDDHLHDPFTWHERLDTLALPWEDCPADGPWHGARLRWLNRNRDTGGGAVQLLLPPGFAGAGAQARGWSEELVVEGEVEADGATYVRWGYRCRAAGEASTRVASPGGALLICWWEVDEAAPGADGAGAAAREATA